MELKRKIAVAITSSALIFNAFASIAFADTNLVITGNGSGSESEAKLEVKHDTTVVQSNDANVTNKVDVDANTGGNKADKNTGGDVKIDTGDVKTTIDVSNALNSNSANVDCCKAGDVNVEISGNGAKSDNDAKVKLDSKTEVYQSNNANVKNDIDVDGNTGDNKAKDNTGGEVKIKTGDVDTTVKISNAANANSALVSKGSSQGGTLSAKIIGNGADSENEIKLDLDHDVLLTQANNSYIKNKVDVDSNTGDNKAEDNTGGGVSIGTGDVDATVDIDNMVNFNQAAIECGCLFDDIWAKISGNGADSDNEIKAKLKDEQAVFQDNCGSGKYGEYGYDHRKNCELKNDVNLDSTTGDNKAKDNTQGGNNDPEITTGDATHDVKLDTSGNVNVFGKSDFKLPDFGFDFNLSLNLADLLNWLASHSV